MADHIIARNIVVRDVLSSGTPFQAITTAVVDPAAAPVSIVAGTTTDNDCAVFGLSGGALDTASFVGSSSWTNAALTGMSFAWWMQGTFGVGGGFFSGSGNKVTAGNCGTFGSNWDGGATKQANISFALRSNGGSLPSTYGVGTIAEGADNVVVDLGIYGTDGTFYSLLVAQTANEELETPAGWTLIASVGVGTPAAAGSVRLTVFGRRMVGGESNPTLTYAAAGTDGTLNVTLDDATVAATGDDPITGDLTVTLDAATLAATGDVPIVATLDVVLDDATLDADGEVVTTGTLTITLEDATVAGAGDLPIVGTLEITLDDAALVAGGGGEPIEGELAVTLEDATLAGDGDATITGTATITLAPAALAAAGTSPITGGLTVTLADATLAAAAVGDGTTGELTVTLADATLTGEIRLDLPAIFRVPIAVPPRRAHERAPRQPRPGQTPDLDRRLHRAPANTIASCSAAMMDEARQALGDAGLRTYEVWSIVVRWSGGERHRGEPRVISELPFLPTPKVKNISSVNRELRAAGQVSRGEVVLEGLSPRYTVDNISVLFPGQLQPGDEHYIEVRGDARDGEAIQRQPYVASGTPERRAFDWTVRLTKQDEARTRVGGQPR